MRAFMRRLAATMFCGNCGKTVEIIPPFNCAECGL